MLELYLLGKPKIRHNGQVVTEQIPLKGQALLYTLALQGGAATRSELAGLLWGEMSEETARTNLRLTLSRLRKEVGDVLQAGRQQVAFYPDGQPYCDAVEFQMQAASQDPAVWRAAAELYGGDLLAEFMVRNAPEFELWLAECRQAVQQTALDLFDRLIEQARAAELYGEGIRWARRLVALAPWHEEAHRHLIWLLAHSGQRSAALAQFEQCRRILAEELAAEPASATILLVEQIRSGALTSAIPTGDALPDLPVARDPAPPAFQPDPLPLTDLMGRESDLVQVGARLADPACRLLTLVGPGGIGKTRLALAAQQAQQAHFADGAIFVALAGVTPSSPAEAIDLLVAHLANALDFTFSAQQPPRELLIYHLRGQHMLLILDNFEQMLDAAGLLAQILQEAPGVKLLVTSRTRLGVAGEWVWDVAGLAWGATPAPGGLAVYPALRLFVECARRIRPDFRPEAEAAAIHQICAFVEGSPLCIELAANWVRTLPCAAIVEKLAQALDLLQADSPIVAPRHQSLRAVLDGAWELLDAAEQQAFIRLAVFDGGFTLDAAEAVAGARLAVLAGLVDASWLKRAADGRFRIHELLRQYGGARLAGQPEILAETQRRHASFYAAFLQARRTRLPAKVEDPIWDEIDPEIDNLRLAWRWWVAQGTPEAVSTYADGLWGIYRSKGWHQEAVGVLSQALAQVAGPALEQARWLRRLAEATYEMGDLDASRRHGEQAMALLGRPVPTTTQGWTLYALRGAAGQALHRLLPRRVWAARRAAALRSTAAEVAATLRRLGPIYYQNELALPLLGETFAVLNLAEQAGLGDETIFGTATVGLACGQIPLPRLAKRYIDQAAQRCAAIQDPATKVLALQVIALYSLGAGRLAATREAAQASFQWLDHDVSPRVWEENTLLYGIAAGLAGEVPGALQRLHMVTDLARYRGDAIAEWWGLSADAEYLLRLDHTVDAQMRLDQIRQLSVARVMPADRFRLFAAEAAVHLRSHDHSAACQVLEQTLGWMDQARMLVVYSVLSYVLAAEVGLALAERAGREDLAQRACYHLERFARLYPIARPALWQMRGRRAARPAQAVAHFRRSLAEATALGMPYEEGQAHVLLASALARQGRPDQASEHEAAARILFARLGAPAHLGSLEAAA